MSEAQPIVFIVRHGETEWSLTGKHTGLTDIPLTPHGEHDATQIGERLQRLPLAKVFASPLQRARRTCELAGFAKQAEIDGDLVEWDYGDYEGLRTFDILAARPDWQLFRHGCPGGESPADVAERADRMVRKARAVDGNVLLFSSGHFLRMFTARWLDLPPVAGGLFVLSTTSLSELTYDHNPSEPIVRQWNVICRDDGVRAR